MTTHELQILALHHVVALAPLVTALARAREITWIDVRTAEEFDESHLPGAVNMPHEHIGTQIACLGVGKDSVIYLYCETGRRAGLAKETLHALGFILAANLGGLEEARANADQTNV
ncbi:MAG: rhodanese-like domain-containing protein [Xanthomonadales bacterium]|nr:rhodanese-like domain-containing protein [Xanthomonadales bacterium]